MSRAGTARVRRTREASKQAMLEVATALLLENGVAGVRVQAVATAVGVTDAAVHYHFQNRAGLMEAVLKHAARNLAKDLTAAGLFGDSAPADVSGSDIAVLVDTLRKTHVDGGAARMLVALALAGWRPRGKGMFKPLVERLRGRKETKQSTEAAENLIVLLNAACIGVAVAGEPLFRAVGADYGTRQQRFFEWLADVADRERN
jgi:TetR/AcrR family transcriptional regulator, repressor for neighboring sulfatase